MQPTTIHDPLGATRRAQLFELRLARYAVAGGGDVRVLSFHGVEATNALYRFRVRVSVPLADASSFSAAAPEAAATLVLHADAGTRFVHGIVGALTTRDVATQTHAVFDLRIVPRLERLRHTQRTRIFQDKTTPEILAQVLTERGIRHRWRLQRTYEKRTYTTQYAESDLAFVQRLAAEEGIFTFFDHPTEAGANGAIGTGEGEVLVYADTAEAVSPIDGIPSLQYRVIDGTGGMTPEEHHVHDFTSRQALRTKGVLLRAFSHESPLLEQRDLASPQVVSASATREPRDPGRIHLAQGLTAYDHLGAREETRLLPAPATIALEQARHNALRGQGRSACRRLVPGRTFRLIDHDVTALDGEYTITRVTHRGRAPHVEEGEPTYTNVFEVVPRAVAARPKRSATRPTASHETAIVVGPAGQEVHTDALGRIKVQFHWDLDGTRDDKSSCWLRVTQAWAGAGFGAQFIPRIGMEVLVAFLGGDPDRPVVTGCLYNGINPPAFTLPEDVERSGFRTRSMPDGGFNELVFGDARGAEFVALKSQGHLTLSAGGSSSLVSAGGHELHVAGALSESIQQARKIAVGETDDLEVTASRSTRIAQSDHLAVGTDTHTTIGGSSDVAIDGSASETIGKFRHVSIGRSGGDDAIDALTVAGARRVQARGEHRLESARALVLGCGQSQIVLLPDRIVLRSPKIELSADEHVRAEQGDPVAATFTLAGGASMTGGTVNLASEGATLVLDTEAKLDGTFVKLNCGAGLAGGPTIRQLTHESGQRMVQVSSGGLPVGTTEVVLILLTPTGETEERIVPVDAPFQLEGPAGGAFVVTSIRVGTDEIPFGQQLGPVDAQKGGRRGESI